MSFANDLLVHEVTQEGVRAALWAERNVVVCHLMGEPDGFDFAGPKADGGRVELGAKLPFEPGSRCT